MPYHTMYSLKIITHFPEAEFESMLKDLVRIVPPNHYFISKCTENGESFTYIDEVNCGCRKSPRTEYLAIAAGFFNRTRQPLR